MTYAVVILARGREALPTGIDKLERSMFERFGKSKEKDHRSGLAAKAADVEAADLEPVVGLGAIASCW